MLTAGSDAVMPGQYRYFGRPIQVREEKESKGLASCCGPPVSQGNPEHHKLMAVASVRR
jgi:hypothetical protein